MFVRDGNRFINEHDSQYIDFIRNISIIIRNISI